MIITTLLFAFIALPFDPAADGRPASDLQARPASAPVMLDFTATWCGPCRQMKPAVESLSRQGVPIKAIDIDEYPEVAQRYKVTGVPAFIVIEPGTGKAIARAEGSQPTAQLAVFYRSAAEKYAREHLTDEGVEEVATTDNGPRDQTVEEPAPAPRSKSRSFVPNPNPWETVVRIKIETPSKTAIFGSGTVIYSSEKESIILTCAHIFHLERGPQAHPSRFPRRIMLDLFDGNLVGRGSKGPSRVHYAGETYEGKAVDYDFNTDVGLIRFSPGRKLPYAHVVPKHWKPGENMEMITVGCSQGRDASAWNTVILNPKFRGVIPGRSGYDAIECEIAPIEGRSGGGLFTSDGYVAGVCDFAEPTHNRGLYASPRSIYNMLDRNSLMALYAPVRVSTEGLMASHTPKRDASPAVRIDLASTARGQSDDHDDSGDLSLPDPELLEIYVPKIAAATKRGATAKSSERSSWHPIPGTTPTDLKHGDESSENPKAVAIPTDIEPETSESLKPVAQPEIETEGDNNPVKEKVSAPGEWKPIRTFSRSTPSAN